MLGLVVVFILYALTGVFRICEWRDRKVSRPEFSLIFAAVFLLEFAVAQKPSLVLIVGSDNLDYFLALSAIFSLLVYRHVRDRLGYVSVVGVDIDGVLGDQVPPVLARLQDKGIGSGVTPQQISSWDQRIGNTRIDLEIEQCLLDAEFVRAMPLVPGSKDAMSQLCKAFHVVVATSRPLETEQVTKAWLKANFDFHEYVDTRQRGKEELGLKYLVEDSPFNVTRFALNGDVALLFSQPWNQEENEDMKQLVRTGRVFRCHGWADVLARLRQLD